MARTFLGMGLTVARRYTNCKGSRTYDSVDKHRFEMGTDDSVNAESAQVFRLPPQQPP